VLRNVSAAEIQAFRHQVQVVDMVGCDQAEAVRTRIAALAQHVRSSCGCHNRSTQPPVSMTMAPRLVATDPGDSVKLDRAGVLRYRTPGRPRSYHGGTLRLRQYVVAGH
jgi:hypothetical protein